MNAYIDTVIHLQGKPEHLMLPVIDLDQVSGEEDLLPLVEQALLRSDTFLLKNYANTESLGRWLDLLREDHQTTPGVPEFDASTFTGVLSIDDQLSVEQYVNDEKLYSTTPPNANCQHILNNLWPMGQFFAQTAVNCYTEDHKSSLPLPLASKLTRYIQTVPEGDEASAHMIPINSSGLLLFCPQATGIKVKPMTASVDDNIWETIDEPDCILVHTGKSITELSKGTHSTTPIQINPSICSSYLTIYPSFQDDHVMRNFILEQIVEFPSMGATHYPKEYNQMLLDQEVKTLIKLFYSCETILSLYSVQRPTSGQINASIQSTVLPQVSTMLGYKVSFEKFLKMMTLWPQCYELDSNPMDEDDLVIVIPRNNKLISMINDSRKLSYRKHAMAWVGNNGTVMEIPCFQVTQNKRKAKRSESINRDKTAGDGKRDNGKRDNGKRSKREILKRTNYNKSFEEKPFDSQTNLLQRIKMKENSLLMNRDRQSDVYDQFLMTKMKQVRVILRNLVVGEPYTGTQLTTMIVDSLYDGNNPIDHREAGMILDKLTEEHPEIHVITTDNALKVYRWNTPLH